MSSSHPSKTKAILDCKCPRCRTGDMYKTSAYNIGSFYKMHETCPHCHFRFQIEPGFFFGATYVSYAMSVALFFVVGFTVYHVFDDPETWVYMLSVIIAIIFATPSFYRYSRVLFLYWFSGTDFDRSKV